MEFLANEVFMPGLSVALKDAQIGYEKYLGTVALLLPTNPFLEEELFAHLTWENVHLSTKVEGRAFEFSGTVASVSHRSDPGTVSQTLVVLKAHKPTVMIDVQEVEVLGWEVVPETLSTSSVLNLTLPLGAYHSFRPDPKIVIKTKGHKAMILTGRWRSQSKADSASSSNPKRDAELSYTIYSLQYEDLP